MSDPFDIPLFREIQKLLSSSEGPINLEFARQTGTAIATGGTSDPATGATEAADFQDAAHSARAVVAGYSRLPFAEEIRTELMGRSRWVSVTLQGWRWLLEQLGARFTGELEKMAGEGESPSAGPVGPLQGGLGQVAPLLIGLQAGMLVGHLAKEALGRYDVPIPRSDDDRLFLVAPNLASIVDAYDLDADALRRWLALQGVARHGVVGSAPWVIGYWRLLLTDVVDAIEVDASDLERRLMEMQSGGLEALQQPGGDEVLPVVQTEQYRRALQRLRGFLALFEGYAGHVCNVVGAEVVPDGGRIAEAMARRDASQSEGRRFLASVLGLSVDRSLEQTGTTFCAAVVKLKGISALNEVWTAPDNLPSLDEIKDPFAWMERVLPPETPRR